ncbi:MAG: hypothetical protein JNJ73_03740 [Hyphomonadaceae bacterium]|nr:hypothetical protein [Hyphomonadaceae bacterium]
MSEEASLYFTAEAALAEQRDELRFGGRRDAASLQAWLKRVFNASEETHSGERRELDERVQAMLEPIRAAG